MAMDSSSNSLLTHRTSNFRVIYLIFPVMCALLLLLRLFHISSHAGARNFGVFD